MALPDQDLAVLWKRGGTACVLSSHGTAYTVRVCEDDHTVKSQDADGALVAMIISRDWLREREKNPARPKPRNSPE